MKNNLTRIYECLAPQEKEIFLRELESFLREKRLVRETRIHELLAFLDSFEDTETVETQWVNV